MAAVKKTRKAAPSVSPSPIPAVEPAANNFPPVSEATPSVASGDSPLEIPGVAESLMADESHDIIDACDLADPVDSPEMPEPESETASGADSDNESQSLVLDGNERAAESTAGTAAGNPSFDALEETGPLGESS